MNIRVMIFTMAAVSNLVSSKPVIAQLDSIGRENYAYAYFYSADNYTEYISSVFCWSKNTSKYSTINPDTYLAASAKSIFINILPDILVRKCICRFEIDSSHYYTSEEALKFWNLKISESKNQNKNSVLISFPDCIHK
jgi:hypothetical protein